MKRFIIIFSCILSFALNGFADDVNALKYFGKGKGSSKNLKISRLINRYQGETNSFFIIQTEKSF